ncbi:MAG: GMC family oxidoreductase [Oligoflexia bacterium]|nr:GMC family oxidoreductase [Oligoflexia bacterium]
MKNQKFDIIVIGSGAGGALSAELLSQSSKVLLIEMGPYRKTSDFDMNEGKAYVDLYQESAARFTKDKGIKVLQGQSVGGGTTVNWTSSFRTPKSVLNHWVKNYGWSPDFVRQIEDNFPSIEDKFSISPWDIPENENNAILKSGLKKMKIKANIIPRNVKDCHNLGYCGMGCPKGAKQSTLVNCIPNFLKNGGQLLHSQEVTSIVEEQKVSKVILKDGREFECDYIFLAAGGVGTPAILKRSGLADPLDLIGKRTFLHPVVASAAIFEEEVNPFFGAPQSIYSDHFIENPIKCGFKLEVPPVHPVLLSSIIPVHGKSHSNFINQIKNLNAIISLFKDGFHKESQGGSVELNSYGQPVLNYPITGYMWESFREALKIMVEIQFEAGAKQVSALHKNAKLCSSINECLDDINKLKMQVIDMPVMSAHVMGGCLMGDDKRASVVDMYGRVRGLKRAYIVDGSLFPTSLGVNPMESILTLSKVITDNFMRGHNL